MNTTITSVRDACSRTPFQFFLSATAVATLWALPGIAHGQIYETDLGTKTVGEYDATTGSAINAALLTGVSDSYGIALSGSELFVSNYLTNTIGEYDATTGAVTNASLISGLNGPEGLVISGTNLFVVNTNANTIGEYTTSGATVNATLITVVSQFEIRLAGWERQ